jgi:hypothetical protein
MAHGLAQQAAGAGLEEQTHGPTASSCSCSADIGSDRLKIFILLDGMFKL